MNKKLKIGIRAHDLNNAPFNDANELLRELKKIDINIIQLVFKKVFKNFEFIKINEVSDILKENNIEVAMLGAYFNMIHSDINKKNNDIEYYKYCLDIGKIFDCHYVGSETGSYNDDKWTFNEKNHTYEAFTEVSNVIKNLQDYSKDKYSDVTIEGAYNHVIYSPLVLNELIKKNDLKYVIVDIFNFLNIDNYKDHTKIFDEAIKLYKDKIVIFHIKDFIINENEFIQVGIGEGLMNYTYIIPKIKKYCPDAYLILEGVKKDKIETSIRYLRSFDDD